jgi:hypothetical protein
MPRSRARLLDFIYFGSIPGIVEEVCHVYLKYVHMCIKQDIAKKESITASSGTIYSFEIMYSLSFILSFINTDVSSTKMFLDISER